MPVKPMIVFSGACLAMKLSDAKWYTLFGGGPVTTGLPKPSFLHDLESESVDEMKSTFCWEMC